LQQISNLWERTKGGKGQVALLCGEAGIGKSRVYEDWLDRITDEPHCNSCCRPTSFVSFPVQLYIGSNWK
jgi:predicted ATPase